MCAFFLEEDNHGINTDYNTFTTTTRTTSVTKSSKERIEICILPHQAFPSARRQLL
jgi:hypothetical protein